MPDPQNDEQLTLGLAALDAFLERFPTHELAGQAHLDAARSLVARGRHQDATGRLETFLADERHRQRKELPAAQVLLGQAYQAQKKFTEAIAAWRDYLARHPTDAAWSTVQQQVINVEYLMALDQYRARDFAAARKLLGEFVAKYPLDSRHPGVLVLLGQMDYREKQWDAAIAQWRRVVSKYPGSEEASFAQYLIAATLEQELGRFEEAIDEYRKVTSGRKMADAAAAISRLAAKSMTVATERVFRSGETPRLKLTTRNVETVAVRAYLVDLETYFRKMQRGGGIEGLDIALIDPDASFEFKIPQYAKYQQLESRLEVPLPGEAKAGVMAVTVTSATLEATTMVIQSDLDVIVKSSRDEVFVFAENMVTGKPWGGVRLLVSDGQRVFAEGLTGEDGVFGQAFAELREAPNVRVLAAAGGHTASNLVELSGVGVSQGLTDKGYLYTDRPVYRPGQRVCVRGVIRNVDGDVYSVEKGKPYRLEVLDPQGRPVRQQDVTLGDFGSFHDEFPLPPTSPQGDYRIVLRDQGEREYQGAFQVAEYRLEPVRLSVDTPRRVYYRGEEIEGSIRAEFYYGAPLAGREVRYQLAGDRVHTARTDGHGEVPFKLPTREYSETQTLALKVWIPEMNLTATNEFMLAARGLEIKVTTVRDVFVSGESFEATVKITDAAGKPASQKATLKVLELTEVEGKFGERLVEEHELQTAADGVARKTITVAQGGRYRLRAEAADRFHQLLDGQCDVIVSGDDDEVRLRVLADRHTYRAGDDATVTLHWRESPALALVTLQGAKVLRYQLVELQTGANKLPLPMTAELAPNFELDVAVMTDARDEEDDITGDDLAAPLDPLSPPGPKKRLAKRFHQASSPFAVERDLQVAVEWKSGNGDAGAVEPGQEVEITVTTTDPQGKPVAAEVSLAMVEKALLERFASTVPAIDDFFRGSLREPSLRTTSSITFNYCPATRPINPRLLSERERADLAAEEAASRREWSLGVESSGAGGGRAGAGMAGGMGGGTFGGGVFSGDVDVPFADGGAMADFDSLISLITNDVSPAEWVDVDGRSIAFGSVDLPLDITESAATHDRSTQKAATADPFAAANGPMPAAPADDFGAKQFITKPATAPARPDFAVHETGYWNPAVVTGDDGRATVTLAVPHRVTAWVLAAKGISHETLAGESVRDLVAKKTLFGQLKLPAAFTAGDEARVIATIHESAAEHGPIAVSLKTTLAGRTIEGKQVVDWSGAGIRELPFDVMLPRVDAAAAGEARFELTVADGERQDVTSQIVPVRPYGLTVYATAGGSADASTTVWVEAPAETPFASPRLAIVVGPTIERSLLDVVFGPPTPAARQMPPVSTGEETAASDLMAALALQKLIAAGSPAAGPEAQALDQRVRAAVSSLVSAQNDKGGWNWASAGDRADPYTSARSVWALSLARKAGYVVPDEAFDKAIQSLGEQAAATDNSDHETKAILLHALASAGQGDFAVANRLYRDRPSLTTAALLHLALAFVEMDRQPVAAELIELVARRPLDDSPAESASHHSPAELRALHALALQAVAPQSPHVKELVDWLLAHRTCHRWSPDRATGPATLALCQWFGQSRFEGEKYRLAITVNGFEAGELELDQASTTETVEVPPRLLVKGKQRIQFQIRGRGRYSYQAILSGFVPADELKSTVAEWRVQRVYEPAPLERDGREIPRGFDVLQGAYNAFRNPLTQLPVGRRGQVELQFSRSGRLTAPDRQLEYLVLTEPLPAGASVVEHSVRGPFERFEIGPGAITFYLGNRHRAGTIRYELVGYLPGSYHAAPSVVRNVYRPEQIAVSTPKSLEVVPSGTASADEYTMTPRELLELGKLAFDGGNMPGARALLAELISKWNLKPDAYRNTVRMLLDAHLETGPAADVVRYFEIVKERWPDEQIPFAKIVKVGAAYHEMGEYERAYLVFRATVESNFTLEGGVAGFLASKGEFLRSVDVMTRLVREYPPESYVAAAQYALAQQVYAKAPEAANDPKLREAKINRVDLIGRAWRMLEAFLTDQPDDPAADRAAFAAANTLLDLEKNAEAAAAAERYARRYPASKLLDSFWYIIGYGRFATGEHEAALAMFRKVAETAP
ncbi:MAG: tetratricopeptide repeat protein, partial [Thermoguttaceae bacterium]|nr:tetratricopeptide repeat protein [Thermoguttaceae bacterium]